MEILLLLMTGDVFGVVPSEVNAVFDYTEYTRFGLWTSETIASDGPDADDPDVSEEQADAADTATGRTMGYAYSPLGNTGLGRADLPSGVKGSYEGYTYAAAADLTIYGGDLTITIDWSVDADMTPDADTTGIEVMISDLVDSDGMGWTDADGDDEDTDDPIVTSITFGSQTGSQLVRFTVTDTTTESTTTTTNTLGAIGRRHNCQHCRIQHGLLWQRIITKLSNWYMTMVMKFMHHGAINGQFLGVSAADSGNADQPRAIIGQWSIGANRLTERTTSGHWDDYDDFDARQDRVKP